MEDKKLLLTCLKFINHLRENNVLDEIEIGNTSCKNCLSKIDLFYKLKKEIEELEGLNDIDLIFLETIQRFNTSEHRDLVKEPEGTFRQETDEEFRKRLIEKYKSIN